MKLQLAENQNGLSVPIKTSQSDICPLQPHASIIFFFSCLQSIVCDGPKHGSSDDLFGEKDPHPHSHSRPYSTSNCGAGDAALVGMQLWWAPSPCPCPCRWGQCHSMPPRLGLPAAPQRQLAPKHKIPWPWQQHSPPPCSSCRHAFIGRHSAYKPQASFWVCCHS